jgi:osmotically inducible protein OsmC
MDAGYSLFHKSQCDRRPSWIDPQRRGPLNLNLALPPNGTLGGKGDATNPEQVFAGGYAACFENALFYVSREARRHFADGDVEVVA